jgi:hypothetical protein
VYALLIGINETPFKLQIRNPKSTISQDLEPEDLEYINLTSKGNDTLLVTMDGYSEASFSFMKNGIQ